MVINGLQECGASPSNADAASNRKQSYIQYAAEFNVDITNEKLDCASMPLPGFNMQGSAGDAVQIYWSTNYCAAGTVGTDECTCLLVGFQTEYSALVEGNYARCNQHDYYCPGSLDPYAGLPGCDTCESSCNTSFVATGKHANDKRVPLK